MKKRISAVELIASWHSEKTIEVVADEFGVNSQSVTCMWSLLRDLGFIAGQRPQYLAGPSWKDIAEWKSDDK